MNIIKYMLYIGLLGLGYNASAMLQPYGDYSAFNEINSLFRQPHETRLEHEKRMDALQEAYDARLAQEKFDALVQEEFEKKANDFNIELAFVTLSMKKKKRIIFLDRANSQDTIEKLKEGAKAAVSEKIKQKEANVAANILLANKQIPNNQLLHTSPEKPNKTLPIDKKRKLIRPRQGSTTPSCMTPPPKRRLFANPLEIEQ